MFSNRSSGKQSRTLSVALQEAKWNSVADNMQQFHDHFKVEFNNIYKLADGSFTKSGLSLQLYLRQANQLVRHLSTHHMIEEQYIFPVLAKKMPVFREDDVHIKSHEAIHEGLDKLSALISKWSREASTYSPTEMRACLDSWREVLFTHLDQEVADLSGENMKKYWTLEEMDQIPM